MIRRGVSETLSEEPDLELVGTGASAQDALRLAKQERPDLILLDIALPGGGIEAATEIAKACPDVKVVMLTVREDRDTSPTLCRWKPFPGATGRQKPGFRTSRLLQYPRAEGAKKPQDRATTPACDRLFKTNLGTNDG